MPLQPSVALLLLGLLLLDLFVVVVAVFVVVVAAAVVSDVADDEVDDHISQGQFLAIFCFPRAVFQAFCVAVKFIDPI